MQLLATNEFPSIAADSSLVVLRQSAHGYWACLKHPLTPDITTEDCYETPMAALAALPGVINQWLWVIYCQNSRLRCGEEQIVCDWLADECGSDISEDRESILEEWVDWNRYIDKKHAYAELARRRFPPMTTDVMSMDHTDDYIYANLPQWVWDESRETWEQYEFLAFQSLDQVGATAAPWILYCAAILEAYEDAARQRRQSRWEEWGILPKNWEQIRDRALSDGSFKELMGEIYEGSENAKSAV